jgi:glycosyltransferase involved in cell wall biosynthesis
MTPRLSILVATIPERRSSFRKLMDYLRAMSDGLPVEILTDDAPKGDISIGSKRQALLNRATGDYIAFIDDDDWVAPTYVDDILKATESGPDCIGFRIEVHGLNRRRVEMASASMRYTWQKDIDGFDYVRGIYHKTPVKRSHAIAIGFADMRFAEDKDYSDRIAASGLLKWEEYIDKALYIYRYKFQPINKKFGITQ